MGPLWEQLEAEAPWLFNELGFKTVYSHYDWQHMGDSIAILQIEELLLRFVRDRGQYSADIAHPSEPKHWWTLFEVHRLIEGVQPKEPLELAAAAEASYLGEGARYTSNRISRRSWIDSKFGGRKHAAGA